MTYDEAKQLEQEALDRYFEICCRVFEQMERDNAWPWADGDSSNPEDLLE